MERADTRDNDHGMRALPDTHAEWSIKSHQKIRLRGFGGPNKFAK